MSADNQLKLAQQIQTVSALLKLPFCTFNAFTITDSLQKLCAYLDAAGTTDIRNLDHYRGAGLDFFFDVVTGHMYPNAIGGQAATGAATLTNTGPAGDANSSAAVAVTNATVTDANSNLFADIGNGRYGYWYYCVFTSEGIPAFVCDVQDIGTPWLSYRAGLEYIGSTVLSAFIAPVGQSIGAAVLGSDTAAAYPALSQAVGNAAVNTALNGGNVQQGVIAAVGGSAGAAVGVQVSDVTCQAIGAAAQSVTTALITGQSAVAAGLTALLKSGITAAVSAAASPPVSQSPAQPIGVQTMDPTLIDTSGLTLSTGFDPNALNPTLADNTTDPTAAASTDLPSVLNTPPNPFDFSSTPNNPLSPPSSVANSSTLSNQDPLSAAAGGIITALAAGAVKALLPALGVTVPATSQTVNANGTITTRNANGTVTTTQIPPGAAYPLPSGGVVTNNGNGTYTTVLPNGTSSTTSYSATATASSSTLLLVGAAVLALVLLGKK